MIPSVSKESRLSLSNPKSRLTHLPVSSAILGRRAVTDLVKRCIEPADGSEPGAKRNISDSCAGRDEQALRMSNTLAGQVLTQRDAKGAFENCHCVVGMQVNREAHMFRVQLLRTVLRDEDGEALSLSQGRWSCCDPPFCYVRQRR